MEFKHFGNIIVFLAVLMHHVASYYNKKQLYPYSSLSAWPPSVISNQVLPHELAQQRHFIKNGRFSGFPAPPSGDWAYPAQVHPGMMGFGGEVNTIFTSPNDVVGGIAGHSHWEEAGWDTPLDPNICRNLQGLTRAQMHLCRRFTDATGAAAIGLKMAVRECRRQFKTHRWNCTTLHSINPHLTPIMNKGYSETAFAHAIASAGVTHSVARACAAGRLHTCACGEVKGRRAWKWSGCHDNTKYGAKFSRMFLDIRERAKDLLSFTHLYNNEIGRKVVRRNRRVQCKCHGMSGSCELRTCWKAAPNFSKVGDLLLQKFRRAKPASQAVFGNAAHRIKSFKPIRRQISIDSPLLYAEKSPPFCEADGRLHDPGTPGRLCNRTGGGPDSCDTLCCGRGFNVRRRRVVKKCQCRFKWCCDVTCQDCSVEEWITVCK